MNIPLIGVTCGEVVNMERPYAPITLGQRHTYTDSVSDAGSIPLIIPIVEDETHARALYEKLDGILLSGGDDIDPSQYGEEPHENLGHTSQRRDAFELQLIRWALEDGKPLLGICRGMQLINIALGGSLHQDIASLLPNSLEHKISDLRKKFDETIPEHTVAIEADTKLHSILEVGTIPANSLHHQAINKVGEGLLINAFASDGIIEGIELPGSNFVIGIQCHPESLQRDAEPQWQKLFQAFTLATQEYSARHRENKVPLAAA